VRGEKFSDSRRRPLKKQKVAVSSSVPSCVEGGIRGKWRHACSEREAFVRARRWSSRPVHAQVVGRRRKWRRYKKKKNPSVRYPMRVPVCVVVWVCAARAATRGITPVRAA